MLSLKREKVSTDSSGDVVIFLIVDLLKTQAPKSITSELKNRRLKPSLRRH
jgi:hypothetical protein